LSLLVLGLSISTSAVRLSETTSTSAIAIGLGGGSPHCTNCCGSTPGSPPPSCASPSNFALLNFRQMGYPPA
jgi:hypothetical protein